MGAINVHSDTIIQASGLVAWYLLVAEVMLGMMTAAGIARITPIKIRSKWRLHTIISWMLLAVVGIHILAILLTHWNGWTIAYITTWGWGTLARNAAVIATWLLLVVVLTSALKTYIPLKVWQFIHRTGPVIVLALATFHGLYASGGSHRLPIIVPGVMALTLLASVFIIRLYLNHVKYHKKRIANSSPRWRRYRFRLIAKEK
jgi:hypothetical protein